MYPILYSRYIIYSRINQEACGLGYIGDSGATRRRIKQSINFNQYRIIIYRYRTIGIEGDISNRETMKTKTKTTRKGIIITALIVAAIVGASFLVYLIPQ